MKKHITLKAASHKEAKDRISAVLDPYLENMNSVNEAGIISIIAEIKEHLIAEFEDFGFEYVDLLDDKQHDPLNPTCECPTCWQTLNR